MTKERRLKESAIRSCRTRGHVMSRFIDFGKAICSTHSQFLARCILCGKTVHVNLSPMPNEVEIGGEAVAIECEYIIDSGV